MRPIATDVARSVVCVSVCVLFTGRCCLKTADDRDAFWGLTLVGPRNHVLDVGQDRTNPVTAASGDKLAMRPFAKLPWTHVWSYCSLSHVFQKWSWLLTDRSNGLAYPARFVYVCLCVTVDVCLNWSRWLFIWRLPQRTAALHQMGFAKRRFSPELPLLF